MQLWIQRDAEARRKAWIKQGVILPNMEMLDVPFELSGELRATLWDVAHGPFGREDIDEDGDYYYTFPGFTVKEMPCNQETWETFIFQLSAWNILMKQSNTFQEDIKRRNQKTFLDAINEDMKRRYRDQGLTPGDERTE